MALFLIRCSEPRLYPQHELAEAILSARPGHDGKLTNQACVALDSKGNCTQTHIEEFDLSDPGFQDESTRLNLTCHAGGKRYKVCRHEKDSAGKPMNGFCRISYKKNCFLFICSRGDRIVDFLPAQPFQPVLDSGMRCFNEELYPLEGSK